MLVKNHRIIAAGAVLGAALMLTGSAFAQGTPCYTTPKPYGGLMFDVSRDLYGAVQPGITYFYICKNAAGGGEVTRYTYRQPLHLELRKSTTSSSCDELPQNMTLDGYYYSQTRMSNPYNPNSRNVRIGWHSGSAQVKTTDAAGNVTVIGTARFEGTIATNTSRKPLPQGVGDCYECGHHTGEIVITFLSAAGANSKLGTIKAFYQFDALYPVPAPVTCDTADQCLTNFAVDGGTLDGINFRVCQ